MGATTTVVHRDDLREVAPLWLEKTQQLRSDRRSLAQVGWVADMWGYAFAAAESGLRHRLRLIARSQLEDSDACSVIHYCYASESRTSRWRWDKRTYRPWLRVTSPPADVPKASVALIAILNEYASLRRRD